ncbi:MAG: hypothetical protein QNJ82_02185 [Gammaproteobacteria bacterium]|nr:hypothetical protein [Gammaproteobacteria bacterium]
MTNNNDFTFKYRIRNWPAYNRALVRRGRLTFWVDEACPYQKPYPRLVERRGQLNVANLKAEGFPEQAERTTAKMGAKMGLV